MNYRSAAPGQHRFKLIPLARFQGHWCADAVGIATMVLVTCVAAWPLVVGGTVIWLDSATQSYPWYSLLGSQLRSGNLPLWNPYMFSGTPFAADVLSGWMYVPAMVLFTLLPFAMAVKAFIVSHLLLSGLGVYALGRSVKHTPLGAVTAGIIYECSGMVFTLSVANSYVVELAAWTPVVLLFSELAIRTEDRLRRLCWWAATGFALSQVLSAFLGQRSYYATLVALSYIGFRTLIIPASIRRSPIARVRGFLVHSAAILLIGLGLAAGGVLPRLEYTSLSTLAEGYSSPERGAVDVVGGKSPSAVASALMDRDRSPSFPPYYVGIAPLALALLALGTIRVRAATTFFILLSVGTVILAMPGTTIFHSVLYALLPRFELLHQHSPDRILLFSFLGIAMLAGSTVSWIERWKPNPSTALLASLLGLAVFSMPWLTVALDSDIGVILILLVAVLLSIRARWIMLGPRQILLGLLAVLLFADLTNVNWSYAVQAGPKHLFYKVDLNRYFSPNGVADFLRHENPALTRYIGFDTSLQYHNYDQIYYYLMQFGEDETHDLLSNNRGSLLHLSDAQGYHPAQLKRYQEFIDTMNGEIQEYHGLYVLEPGLQSPLADLLNIRFIVIPKTGVGRPDLHSLASSLPTVYEDEHARVLENTSALPRTWIVHDVRQMKGQEALAMLASGGIDPRTTVLLEETPPSVDSAATGALSRSLITSHSNDRIEVSTSDSASGMLVLSEVYYPAWKAYVDGRPTPLYVADHALRAVRIPAGDHKVELKYESTYLRVGIALSFLTAVLAGTPWLLITWRWWQGLRLVRRHQK